MEPIILNAFDKFTLFAMALDEYLQDDEAKATFTPLDEWRATWEAFRPLFEHMEGTMQ